MHNPARTGPTTFPGHSGRIRNENPARIGTTNYFHRVFEPPKQNYLTVFFLRDRRREGFDHSPSITHRQQIVSAN